MVQRAWQALVKVSARVVVGGDINNVHRNHPEAWAGFLITYETSTASTALDRCLVPEEWHSAAQLRPQLCGFYANAAGHKILRMKLNVKPTVLNDPARLKHDTIPSCVFMPGRDGGLAQPGANALQGPLLRRTVRSSPCPYTRNFARNVGVSNSCNRDYRFEYCTGSGEGVQSQHQ